MFFIKPVLKIDRYFKATNYMPLNEFQQIFMASFLNTLISNSDA